MRYIKESKDLASLLAFSAGCRALIIIQIHYGASLNSIYPNQVTATQLIISHSIVGVVFAAW
jgi:N-methylhydantoinase B/oxoprolinase/acetone carboxylase alpha subunit